MKYEYIHTPIYIHILYVSINTMLYYISRIVMLDLGRVSLGSWLSQQSSKDSALISTLIHGGNICFRLSVSVSVCLSGSLPLPASLCLSLRFCVSVIVSLYLSSFCLYIFQSPFLFFLYVSYLFVCLFFSLILSLCLFLSLSLPFFISASLFFYVYNY